VPVQIKSDKLHAFVKCYYVIIFDQLVVLEVDYRDDGWVLKGGIGNG
jgi:hypothetical protein